MVSGQLFAGLLGLAAAMDAGAEALADAPATQQVDVVGSTPLPGSDVSLRQLPANAQLLGRAAWAAQPTATLTELLDQQAVGVSLNAAQGNRYQPDLNFRGFSASPLLGTPQGLSVFFDGMRVNEAFGDTVNWDLIPDSAIARVQLLPGSHPAFGLNTLGGAIALSSKRGAQEYPEHPGGLVSLTGGSFGRRALNLEGGGRRGAWDWFVTTHQASDQGWVAHNRSRIRQLLGRLGWQDEDTELGLTLATANNRMEGAQTTPQGFDDPRQPYTYPDLNRNRGQLAQLQWRHTLSPAWQFSGQLYVRGFRNNNLSSNVNNDFGDDDPVQAHNDASVIRQSGQGGGAQWTWTGRWADLDHQLSLGLSADQGRAHFSQATQAAMFLPDRATQGIADFEPTTDADTRTRYQGAFLSDLIALSPRWTLSLAARWNQARVSIADRSGAAPELNGEHRFRRLNPALGLSFNPSPAWTLFGGYNEGLRAPTAMELTCADPNAPCKLPNNFLADPPLHEVVSKTWEAGVRGQFSAQTNGSVAVFRTDLHKDLQFVSSGGLAANAGYFQNIGLTRRQGLELAVDRHAGAWSMSLRYSFTDATYRSAFTANSPSNSSADGNGGIRVQVGDRLPAIPRHSLKSRLAWAPTAQWSLAATLQLASAMPARGDDNQQDTHGAVPGHGLLNLDARWTRDTQLSLFARLDNVFNRRCANFAVLGQNAFTGPSDSFDGAHAQAQQFRGYGSPRGLTAGLDYRFE
jgi:iron complex outermembrane recepter protein